jgi:hypothetical protein
MKKLSALVLKEKAEFLNDQKMKMVNGGYGVSSSCNSGEYLYNCTVFFIEGTSTIASGGACATSAAEAREKVLRTYHGFGYEQNEIDATCN